jgi:malic enzyme
MHRGGKISVRPTVDMVDRAALAMAYTPGVARVCTAIAEQPELAADYTWVSNTVAIVTDGTAVLGLGDIGPAAAMPVMEGKSLLFQRFAGVDAVPICLACAGVDEIVATVAALAPSFGGINLEDISAPRCFEIEDRLRALLDIPVLHDDQHGTAIVTLAALRGAARVAGQEFGQLRAVVAGAGASGIAVTKMLLRAGIGDIATSDSKGLIYRGRDGLNPVKAAPGRADEPGEPDRLDRVGAGRRRRVHRPVEQFGGRAGHRRDGAGRDRLRAVQPRPRGSPGDGGPARSGGRHRAQRLRQPDQQLAGLPRCVPRRPGHPRQRHHRRHKAGRR